MAADIAVVTQLRQNTVRQLFTQLHAPLIEGEDVENCPLGEDFVLIQRNQRPQAKRSYFPQQDGVGRTITFKHFKRYNVLQRGRIFTLVTILLLNYLAGFTDSALWVMAGAIKSHGTILVPWWISW